MPNYAFYHEIVNMIIAHAQCLMKQVTQRMRGYFTNEMANIAFKWVHNAGLTRYSRKSKTNPIGRE